MDARSDTATNLIQNWPLRLKKVVSSNSTQSTERRSKSFLSQSASSSSALFGKTTKASFKSTVAIACNSTPLLDLTKEGYGSTPASISPSSSSSVSNRSSKMPSQGVSYFDITIFLPSSELCLMKV